MTAMPTSIHTTRRAPLTAALTGTLLLTAAIILPGAYAQMAPPPVPTDPAPAQTPDPTSVPPTIQAPPETPAPATETIPPVTSGNTPTQPAPAPTEEPHKSRFRIGPTVGVFLPTDSKTRDRFSSAWLSLGLGLGPVSGVTNKGGIGFDINLLYQKHNDNHALIVPIGVGYRVALINTTNPDGTRVKTVPYAGLTADYYLINFKSRPDNVNGTFGAGGGSALIGVNFSDTANLEARYQFTSKTHDFDFSGLNLTAGYRF